MPGQGRSLSLSNSTKASRSDSRLSARKTSSAFVLAIAAVPLGFFLANASFMGFSTFHEFGHVLGAWLTGGSGQVMYGSLAYTSGGSPLFVSLMGPIGQVLFPAIIVAILGLRHRWPFLAWMMVGCLAEFRAWGGYGDDAKQIARISGTNYAAVVTGFDLLNLLGLIFGILMAILASIQLEERGLTTRGNGTRF